MIMERGELKLCEHLLRISYFKYPNGYLDLYYQGREKEEEGRGLSKFGKR